MKKDHEIQKFFKKSFQINHILRVYKELFGFKSLILRFGLKSRRLDVRHPMGSRTTSRRDFKPKGLQAEIKTLQAPQNTMLSSVKRYFSKILASLVHNKRYS